jgi:hypothetical protein
MAVILVSNSGGLFTSPSTWVGGNVPVYPDSIGFTATSGNLTMDSQETLLGIDFTNFTGTFRVLAGNTGLNIVDDTIGNAGFINMGTGGYTLIDDGSDFGITVQGTPPAILTNTVGKINPIKFGLYGQVIINGNWLQQGVMTDGGSNLSIDIQNGTLTMLGTQNFNFGLFLTGNSSANFVFNGIINMSDLQVDGGTYTVIGGIFNCATGVFIENILTNTVIDFNGTVFPSITLSGTAANNIQLNSVLLGSTLNLDGNIKLTGNFGFNTDILTDNYFNPATVTFKSGNEYFVNNQINITNTIMLSSIAGVKSKLTLGQNIDQLRVVKVTATDIDSSNGRRVNNFYGSATNCDNWRIWNDNTLPQAPSTF